MKCLEFLYFYLMDETTQDVALLGSQPTPSTPVMTPSHGSTRLGGSRIFARPASNSSFGSSSSSSLSSRSAFSVGTNSSQSSVRTPSPVKKSYSTPVIGSDPHTPPQSPPPVSDVGKRTPRAISTRLMMLRKEVDYEPQSPKKAHGSRVYVSEDFSTPRRCEREEGERMRTTEEKKEILGTLLGNVDALVEGVRKAGIWGLT